MTANSSRRKRGGRRVYDDELKGALLHVLEPIFDSMFAEHSYGFRHGRGCHHALERVEELLAAGNAYVVDADLKSYFDTISKPRLMARVREKVSDCRVLRMVEMYLEQGVLDGLREWTPGSKASTSWDIVAVSVCSVEPPTPRLAHLFPTQSLVHLWLRTRLRAILRKRQKRHGRARGKDLQRWPNGFFDEQGLYSLQAAHVRFVQSSWR